MHDPQSNFDIDRFELLYESEKKYRLFFEKMNEGFGYHEVVLDDKNNPIDYIFRDVNSKFLKFLNLYQCDIIDKKATECLPNLEISSSKFIKKLGKIGIKGGEISFEFYSKSVKTWFNVSVFSPKKNFFCTLLENINERKESEFKIQEINKKLEISNKELEQFAYVASHDLQEPLRMVSSFTQLLAQKYKGNLDEKADTYINFAVDGAKRMQILINDLLDYSRVYSRGGDFVSTKIEETVKKALFVHNNSIKKSSAKIEIGSLPELNVDPNQIERVFSNMIGNALKFRNEKLTRIKISATKKNNKWVFSVEDNGIGIDMKYKEKVFQIFQRLHTRDEYSGTGIGLAICKRIINLHQGDIWFESTPGKGTIFYFSIPINLKNQNNE